MRTVNPLELRRSDSAPALGPGLIIEHAPQTPFPRVRKLLIAGTAVVGLFIVGLGTWSVLAPLQSAAIAPAVVEVETHRKTVQHLEGGIIASILVKDGDLVSAGQPLVRLDDTKARTAFATVQSQLYDAYARRARLLAERDGLDTVTFPEALRTAAEHDSAVAQIVTGQQTIFKARRTLLESKVAAIGERIRQSAEEIRGLQAQDQAAGKRLGLVDEELQDVRQLLQKGLERKSRLLQLERDRADTAGNRGQLAAQIARAQQVIAESQINIITLKNDRANEVAQQLRETEEKVSQLEEQRQDAADVLNRVEVRAPEEGIVTNLRVHTAGGVVRPGDPLLDLVPKVDRMVVNARVRPEDMDLVRPGLPALVRLLPYKQRRTPPLAGTVVTVSPDRLIDERPQGYDAPGQPYFLAKVEISKDALKELPDVKLIPGMPAEVMIETGQTTVALYALAPILDSFNRAFREK